ncbi:hypothetical protein EVG20_g10684 [Dentipellis fragilis]|uniref:Uncharacterized protein n=1 Tax=Dentipellis fragilis TaxID=205917 RepID=A0A4Y9XUB7_9AGAM|nr:hypothetical protein EVG20_g10684 [Dentipellis fragilis]
MPYADEKAIAPLRDTIVDKPPFVSGVLALPADLFKLFFSSGGDSQYITLCSCFDLANATPSQLDTLSSSCAPAPFGLKNENVLDETYRKAGKMDCSDFSTPLVPERTSLIDIIRAELLEGEDSKKPIKVELYKLNVYSEGSFFKAHQDTPRGEYMFGSLVLVFPTPHQGGSLILRHGGHEWSFDSATELDSVTQNPGAPNIGFVSFFSDVEHEVSLVESGHRVTLTYNLYLTPTSDDADPEVAPVVPPHQASFKAQLEALFADPEFLPDGGSLGFGLRHVYPVKDNLSHISKLLKGSDAVIQRICAELGLKSKPALMYEDVDFYDMNFLDVLKEEFGGRTMSRVERSYDADYRWVARRLDEEIDEYVTWVTEPTSETVVEGTFPTYGNEAQVEYSYGHVCLIVPHPTCFCTRNRFGKPVISSEFLAFVV